MLGHSSIMKIDKKLAIKILGYLVSLGVGIYFLRKTLKDQDLHQVFDTLSDAHLGWIGAVILVSFIGHFIRVLRWQMIIKSAGHEVQKTPIFHSLLFGYLVNYLVPRLGEVTRCMSLKKVTGVPATKLFGTVLVERLIDMSTLLIVLPTVFFLQYDRFKGLLEEHIFPFFQGFVDKAIDNKFIVGGIVIAIIVGFVMMDKKLEEKEKEEGGLDWFDNMWEGITSIRKVKNIPLLVIYSILIWGYYFVTNYFCLLSLDSDLRETWAASFATGAFGSIGRSLPIAGGGMGAYHFIIAQVLLQFGVAGVFATSMAIIFHGVQMVFHLTVGAVGGIWVTVSKTVDEIK